MRDRIVSLELALDEEVLSLPGGPGDWPGAVRHLLADPATAKSGFNLKQAWVALGRAGTELAGNLFDLFLADYLLKPGGGAERPRDWPGTTGLGLGDRRGPGGRRSRPGGSPSSWPKSWTTPP